jgi:hypothetical protein
MAKKDNLMKEIKNKKVYKTNIMSFDCESYVEHMLENTTPDEHSSFLDENGRRKNMKTYLICSRIGDEKKSFQDVDSTRSDYSTSFCGDFWKYVHETALTQEKKTLYVYGHYVTADILQSNAFGELEKLGYKVLSYNASQPVFVNFVNPETDSEIKIWDSWALFHTKLATIGESLNDREMKKGDFHDHDVEPTPENLLERVVYCHRDVDILHYALDDLQKWLYENEFGGISMTGAGVSLKAYRSKFLHKIELHNHQTAINIERECYHGGRTEMWRKGRFENIPYIDVNSMYPAEMLKNRFPTKLVSVEEFKTPIPFNSELQSRIEGYLDQNYLLCMIVKIKTEEPVFPKKHDGKTVFPVGTYTTGLCTPEIIYAIENNLIVEVLAISVYESEKIFEAFVDFFYKLRLQYKKQGLSALEMFVKIILNSLYGKFGQMETEQVEMPDFDKDLIPKEFGTAILEGKQIDIMQGKAFLNYRQGNADNAFVAIAAHVTAYARMNLWKIIEAVGRKEVLYMDTDSLHLTQKGYKRALELGFIDSKELGKFKLEFMCVSVEFFGCKDYTMTYLSEKTGNIETKTKKKGVNLPKAHNMGNNVYETSRGTTLKDCMRHNDMSAYGNNWVKKTYTGIYTKGSLGADGIVTPIVLDEDTSIYMNEYEKRKKMYVKRELTESEKQEREEKRLKKLNEKKEKEEKQKQKEMEKVQKQIENDKLKKQKEKQKEEKKRKNKIAYMEREKIRLAEYRKNKKENNL